MTIAVSDWGMATWTGLTAGLASFYSYLPNVIGAMIILLFGWLVAGLMAKLTEKLLEAVRFDAIMARSGVDEAINRSGVRVDPSELIATLVKWSVVLVAFMMAADALHLPQVSIGIAAILAYVPRGIAAALILGGGFFLAAFVRRLVRAGASGAGGAGVRAGDLLADFTYWAIVVLATLGAVEQLDIAPNLVQTLYTAVVGAVALAAALAFGLGLREQARDIVAGQALAEQLQIGDEIVLEHVRGRVQRIGTLMTLIQSGEGLVSIPNHLITEGIFRVSPQRFAPMAGGGGGQPHTTLPKGQTAPSWMRPATPPIDPDELTNI